MSPRCRPPLPNAEPPTMPPRVPPPKPIQTAAIRSRRSRASRLASLLPVLVLLLGFEPCGEDAARRSAAPPPFYVFAAASLADVMEEQSAFYLRAVSETSGPRTEALGETSAGASMDRPATAPGLEAAMPAFHFAGSNLLALQLQAGARAHLFLSADRRQVDALVDAGRIDPSRVIPLLANRLVVIAPAVDAATGAPPAPLATPPGLLAVPRIALADPEAVPAGVYAREWLVREGLWTDLEDRVVPTLDVRAALAAVAAGHLPAAVVYATDAATTDAVAVVYEVPPERAPPIRYYAAPVETEDDGVDVRRPHLSAAAAFLDYLTTPEAAEIFRRHGFQPLLPEATSRSGDR